MTRRLAAALATAAATIALTAGGAGASTMHSALGARLSGMGAHGLVNLQVTASAGKLCWAFNIPTVKGATRATIHSGSGGAMLLELGMRYAKTGCVHEPAMTLEHLEAKPAAYSVWVDTKSHPGDVRGVLFVGMAHM